MSWGDEDRLFRSLWDCVLAALAMVVVCAIIWLIAYTGARLFNLI